MIRFANRMDSLSENNDSRKLENEKIFIMRKIEEVRNEIIQLENNIQFFTNTRNAKKENSIVLEVRKNIAIHKESLDTWKEKLKQLRNLKQE
jgi:conjugal transfer/entry exclusion protein